MSITDQKITDAEIAAAGVQSQPNKLTGTAAENKAVFDALVKNLVKVKLNALIDELLGAAAAGQIGVDTISGLTASNVQQALQALMQNIQGVTQGAVADGSITAAKLADGSVENAKLADGAVDAAKLADNAVTTARLNKTLGAQAVTADTIRQGAILTSKISDGQVTTAKLAAKAVSTAKLADGAVESGKLAAGAVTNGKLADGAVTTAKIANGQVTAAKLSSNPPAVETDRIKNGAVSTAKLADGAVTAAKLAADLSDRTRKVIISSETPSADGLEDGAIWLSPSGGVVPGSGWISAQIHYLRTMNSI